MRPIFEQPPLAFPPPGGTVDQAAIIIAEARESGEIMRAGKHIDAVDLVERQPVYDAAEASLIDAIGQCRAEALRGERDPPRLGERQLFGQGRSASPAARA